MDKDKTEKVNVGGKEFTARELPFKPTECPQFDRYFQSYSGKVFGIPKDDKLPHVCLNALDVIVHGIAKRGVIQYRKKFELLYGDDLRAIKAAVTDKMAEEQAVKAFTAAKEIVHGQSSRGLTKATK